MTEGLLSDYLNGRNGKCITTSLAWTLNLKQFYAVEDFSNNTKEYDTWNFTQVMTKPISNEI